MPSRELPADDAIIIRQSTVESMTLCPARVGFSNQEGFDHTPSEPMAFGSLVHLMIETHLEGTDAGRIKLSLPQAIENMLAEMLAKEGHDLKELTNSLHVTKIALEAREAYEAWKYQVWPSVKKLKPTAIEELRLKFIGLTKSGREVWVQGTPDYVYEWGILDWKTAGRGWEMGKAHTRIQSALYTLLEDFDVDAYDVPFTYWVYNRSKREWSDHSLLIQRRHIDAAIAACMQWAEMIEAQAFPPTPSASAGKPGRGWWCSAKFCGAWNICHFKDLLTDGKNTQEVRAPAWT